MPHTPAWRATTTVLLNLAVLLVGWTSQAALSSVMKPAAALAASITIVLATISIAALGESRSRTA